MESFKAFDDYLHEYLSVFFAGFFDYEYWRRLVIAQREEDDIRELRYSKFEGVADCLTLKCASTIGPDALDEWEPVLRLWYAWTVKRVELEIYVEIVRGSVTYCRVINVDERGEIQAADIYFVREFEKCLTMKALRGEE